jgi:hypothetical protein
MAKFDLMNPSSKSEEALCDAWIIVSRANALTRHLANDNDNDPGMRK